MIALIVFLEGTAHPDRQSPSIAPAGSTVCMVSCFDCWAGTMFLEQSQRPASSLWINHNGYTRRLPPPPASHALNHENTPLHPRRTTPGVAEPEPCPLGTYGNTTGLRKISDCNDCDPGSYCDQRGLTNPAGLCDPGYYCLDGSYTSAPNAPGSPLSIEDTDIGGLCPGERWGRAKGGVRTHKLGTHRQDASAGSSVFLEDNVQPYVSIYGICPVVSTFVSHCVNEARTGLSGECISYQEKKRRALCADTES